MTRQLKLLATIAALLGMGLVGLAAGAQQAAEEAGQQEQVLRLINVDGGKPIANAKGRLFEIAAGQDYPEVRVVENAPAQQTDADGNVRVAATGTTQLFVPDSYTPVLSIPHMRAALARRGEGTLRIECRRWQALEVEVRAKGLPAAGATVFACPLLGGREGGWLEYLVEPVVETLEGNPRHRYQRLVDTVRGLRVSVECHPDLQAVAMDGDISLENLPKQWLAIADEHGRCRFDHIPDCHIGLLAWSPTGPLSARCLEPGAHRDKQLLEIAETAAPKLRVRLHRDELATEVEFGIAPVLGHGVSWTLQHGEGEFNDYVFTGLEPGIFTLGYTDSSDARTVSITESREYLLEQWTGTDLCQVTAAISRAGETLTPLNLSWRKAEDLHWCSQGYDALRPPALPPGRYMFRVSDTLQTEVELARGQTRQVVFELPLGDFLLKPDPRLVAALGVPLTELRFSVRPLGQQLYEGGYRELPVLNDVTAVELATLRKLPRLVTRVAVSGFGGEETFEVDLTNHAHGEVLVGKTELDATGEFQLSIAPGAQALLRLEVGKEPRISNSLWTTLGDLSANGRETFLPFSRTFDERNPVERTRNLRVPNEGGEVSITLPPAEPHDPTWLSLWARPGDKVEIDCANPAPGAIRLHLASQNNYWVRVVDAKCWVWSNYGVSDTEAVDEILFSIPCNPGRATVQVSCFSHADRYGSGLELVAEAILDVAPGTTDLPWEALQFGPMKLGELEVAISGVASPDRNTAAWTQEIGWASRFGETWHGQQVTVHRLEGGRPVGVVDMGWPVGVSNPVPVRTFHGGFAPGEYRVIPWPGAPERLWRTVTIRQGETTRVEFKLE